MIFVFVVDTSASMNRSFSGNLSYLESAKSGIEHFFKWEHSSSNRMNNKYMLVTYEDQCYKTLLDTDNDQVLLQEVKLLQATDLSTAGATFGTVLEYLDAYRRSNSFDTIGRGRYPADSETTTIFWFTDGSNFSEKSGDKWVLSDELHIPRLQTPGQEFYHEPFRWDQRLFTLWMTQAVHPESKVPQMSTVMRGEWWQIPNVKYLMQCIDNCMHYKHANVHPFAPICNAEGVLVNMIESPVTATNGPAPVQTLMIYSNKSSTHHFPIPEAYWVDAIAPGPSNILTIPPRSAHPTILYTKRDDIYPIPEGFPVDRFSIDQKSEIVQELMKQKEKISWTLFVQFSNAAQDFGAPFGTLKYSESSKTVSMYLMPYNFPLLFAAILELRKRSLAAAAAQNIADYVRSVPIYYREPLRRAFAQINIMNLWPTDIPALPTANPHIDKYYMETVQKSTIMMAAVHKRVIASRATDHELLRKRSAANPLGVAASLSPMLFENVFDIPREALIPALTDLRNALRKTVLGPSKRQRLSVLEEGAYLNLPPP
ncbi:hypothetical protein PhCBS80983_g02021 [Powellomyces hirtus]|uniref:Uncharacterized protein n=1 Tax=Powellomyces hirtus TaxID=109895 RepID=A0A507E9S6_9FUNG|nr:hypothetical protein PhCBS80983_g02021 [Powellomyces hirtus]